MVLEDVTGPAFSELEDLIQSPFPGVCFMGSSGHQAYNYRQEVAWIEMYEREYIDEFVRRGALRDPRVMLELGHGLLAKLKSQLEERRNRRR